MKRDDYEELMGFSGTHKQDGTLLVHFDDFDRLRDAAKVLIVQNAILNRAVKILSQAASDYCDRLEIENFGEDCEYSVAIAQAATHYGLANPGDSAFDLKGLTAKKLRGALGIIVEE